MLQCSLIIICVLAFPEEFISSEIHNSCKADKKNSMNRFPYGGSTISNTSNDGNHFTRNSSLNECERYCGGKSQCWGCIKDCQEGCQWIALLECNSLEAGTELVYGDILQKPGIYN